MAPRLYLVTPPALEPEEFAASLEDVLGAADIAALRVRLPGAAPDDVARAVAAILKPAHARGVAVIADADPKLARAWGCDGAHVAAKDVIAAREVLGSNLTLGAACAGSYHVAMEAAEEGADYVWFCAAAAGEDTVTAWAAAMVVPCIVGGGIDAKNAASWGGTGAEFLAVGRAAWGAAEPVGALRRITTALG